MGTHITYAQELRSLVHMDGFMGGQHGDAFRVDGGDMGTPLGFGAATRRMGDGSLGVVGQGGLGVA